MSLLRFGTLWLMLQRNLYKTQQYFCSSFQCLHFFHFPSLEKANVYIHSDFILKAWIVGRSVEKFHNWRDGIEKRSSFLFYKTAIRQIIVAETNKASKANVDIARQEIKKQVKQRQKYQTVPEKVKLEIRLVKWYASCPQKIHESRITKIYYFTVLRKNR